MTNTSATAAVSGSPRCPVGRGLPGSLRPATGWGGAARGVALVPRALELLSDPIERRPLRSCAGAVTELLPESGDGLLHWDLHFENVLSRLTDSAPGGVVDSWRAIDPRPLAGDPGFELLPALHNRWDVVGPGNMPRAVRMRFDLGMSSGSAGCGCFCNSWHLADRTGMSGYGRWSPSPSTG
jgi:hypothetical protein